MKTKLITEASDRETRDSGKAIGLELSGVGARLAGVSEALRKMADSNDCSGSGNVLHLLADVVDDANTRCCECSSAVENLLQEKKDGK